MHILVMAAILSWVPLPPPTPTPSETSKEKQNATSNKTQKATPDERQPQPSPTINSKVITETRDNKSHQKSEKSSTDWWLTVFTGALVVVAVLQFIAMHRQAEYMRRGLRISIQATRASKQAANAAKQNADALINAERAWVLAEFKVKPGVASMTDYSLTITNHGRTLARITDIEFGCDAIPVGSKNIPDLQMTRFPGLGLALVPNQSLDFDRFDIAEYFMDSWTDIQIGKRTGVFEFRVHYLDIVDARATQHMARILYIYKPYDHRLVLSSEHSSYT